jgi:hypothetical protein
MEPSALPQDVTIAISVPPRFTSQFQVLSVNGRSGIHSVSVFHHSFPGRRSREGTEEREQLFVKFSMLQVAISLKRNKNVFIHAKT